MVYTLVDLLPPLIIGGVTVLLGVFSVMFVMISMFYKFSQGKRVRIPCLSGMYAAISVVFRDAIKKKNTENGPVFVLWNRKLAPAFIPCLFLIIPGLFACFFLSFWDTFLIENSYTCDPALDCFPIDAENDNLQNDPIVNCSDFDTSDNITILCYQFVFKFTAGTAFAGGLLSFTAIGIKLLGSLLVWSLNLDGKGKQMEEEDGIECCECCNVCWPRCYCCLKVTVLITLVFSPLLFSIVTIIIVIAVPFVRDALSDRQRGLQFGAYYVIIFYIGILVPIFVALLRRSKPYEKFPQTEKSKASNNQRSSYTTLN